MKEWYIEEYEDKTYLHNKELLVLDFPDIEGEHDHCELCWARFSKYPGDLHGGYFEPHSKSWICGECFRQFHGLFGWTVGSEGLGDGSVVPSPDTQPPNESIKGGEA